MIFGKLKRQQEHVDAISNKTKQRQVTCPVCLLIYIQEEQLKDVHESLLIHVFINIL